MRERGGGGGESGSKAPLVLKDHLLIQHSCQNAIYSTNDDQTELFPHSAGRDGYKECIYELGDKLKSVHVHFDLRKLQITSAMNIARERS